MLPYLGSCLFIFQYHFGFFSSSVLWFFIIFFYYYYFFNRVLLPGGSLGPRGCYFSPFSPFCWFLSYLLTVHRQISCRFFCLVGLLYLPFSTKPCWALPSRLPFSPNRPLLVLLNYLAESIHWRAFRTLVNHATFQFFRGGPIEDGVESPPDREGSKPCRGN